eukprot:TRINITY_DN8_c0_g1_i5.p1 TRINITY_DN8_c0_g1~~TRINITY_DN8_c0_g1_i5.p1  ORF type:complete len:113 (+),score=12.96 TRINITY_DN8_c0_g1_i5:78-416(+)
MTLQYGKDWKTISQFLGNKTDMECESWYEVLERSGSAFELAGLAKRKRESDLKPKNKRTRKTADTVKRDWPCHFLGCEKAYGSETALKLHWKRKHPSIGSNHSELTHKTRNT